MLRILLPVLKFDYGIRERGPSLEASLFFPALSAHAEVTPLWLEDHGYPNDRGRLQEVVLAKAQELNPDLIFLILMRDEITSDTLSQLGKRWRTCNWFADDQWRFETFSRVLAPKLWRCITVDKYSIAKYHRAGFDNVTLSQWAANIPEVAPASGVCAYDVSFVGGRNTTRAWLVDRLEKRGIKVACFGAGWPKGRIEPEKMVEVAMSSKICLNLSNSVTLTRSLFGYWLGTFLVALVPKLRAPRSYLRTLRALLKELLELLTSRKNAEQIKARNFEIPAWGGFQVSQFALGVDDYFIPGKEIVLYSSFEELVTLLEYYLTMEDEREAIRAAGSARARSHTFDQVMGRLVQDLDTLAHEARS